MSWVNIGEVAHQLERRIGLGESELVVDRLLAAVALGGVTPGRVLAAAHIKATHPIAFADCLAIASATARAAALFTCDAGPRPQLLGSRSTTDPL
jgi:predicted nucleic acid-binding protein